VGRRETIMVVDRMPDGSWRYGDAGDRFPISPGDVWASGGHVLACGDIERGSADELLNRFAPRGPACAYTDPPFNAAQATSFRTKAGVNRRVDFDAFLDKLMTAVFRVFGFSWVETGIESEAQLLAAVSRVSREPVSARRFEVTYYGKAPSLLFAFARPGFGDALFWLPDLRGMDDERTPREAILASCAEGATVFDPCLGRGLTCRTAQENNRKCIGMELHPRRLACVLAWLKDEHGHSPSKVGELETMKGA